MLHANSLSSARVSARANATLEQRCVAEKEAAQVGGHPPGHVRVCVCVVVGKISRSGKRRSPSPRLEILSHNAAASGRRRTTTSLSLQSDTHLERCSRPRCSCCWPPPARPPPPPQAPTTRRGLRPRAMCSRGTRARTARSTCRSRSRTCRSSPCSTQTSMTTTTTTTQLT